MKILTGNRHYSDTCTAGVSKGDEISDGTQTTLVDTASATPTHRVTVDYPSLGPVTGYLYTVGGTPISSRKISQVSRPMRRGRSSRRPLQMAR